MSILLVAPEPLLAEEATDRTFRDDLAVEASVDVSFERFGNADLDGRTSDGVSSFLAEVTLGIDYQVSDHVAAYVELLAEGFQLVDKGDDVSAEEQQEALNLSQLYLDIDEFFEDGMLRVGRQAFYDTRDWLYADELDGVRVFYARERLSLELSVSRERLFTENVFEENASEEHVNNYILYGSYQPGDDHLVSAYVLARDDRKEREENPIFYGLRASGTAIDALDYWLDLAQVRGRDGSDRLRGVGVDLGGSYRLAAPWSPSLTLAYAFGSGDSNPDDDIDHRFRQTGLHDNISSFSGVEDFLYYGETLAPELSNLKILTLGFGLLPSEYSSIDVIYHRYRQDVASSEGLEASAILAPLNGESRDIGQAIDVVVGYHELSDILLRSQLGYFRPGAAFDGPPSHAYSVVFGIEYLF